MYHNATMPTGAAPEGLPQPTVPVTQGCQDPFEHAAQEFELSDKPKAARRKRVQNLDIDSDCYVDTGVSTAAEHSCAALPRRSASMQGHLKLQITADPLSSGLAAIWWAPQTPCLSSAICLLLRPGPHDCLLCAGAYGPHSV